VVVQRNSHASVVDGLVLSGGVPAFVAPEYDAELGMANGVEPAALERALAENPDVRAAFIVSPTYYGMIAGALTQAAMLHVADGRVDAELVSRSIRLVRSTSPSSLLLASLDGARRQLALHGEQMLHETLQAIAAARAKLETVPHVAVIDNADPLRIVLDLRVSGRTGYEWSDALRRNYDVNVELATQATIVFLVGLGERPETLLRLVGDVEEVGKRIAREGETSAIIRPPATLRNEMAVSPRDAFLGRAELVSADDAVGRVSCESIAGYPPGIPALLPGERIGVETVAYLREIVAGGARLHGASDPAFATVHVLIEE
jgi:arginine decarboxylase